ncbi:MAG: diguanylate cyclase [Planctomycetes bacterium]|nr:diguanylate cyclase [Planctomycetota bacterium]
MTVRPQTKAQLIAEIKVLRQQLARAARPPGAQDESERKYRAIFDEAPLGYHELDAEGRIVRVNRTELDMLGYASQEMVGRHVWEFIGEQQVSQQAVLAKLAGTRPPGRSSERTYRRKDGTPIPVTCEDRLIRDDEGRITGIRTAIQDITDRKRAEDQVRQTSEELARLVTQLEEKNRQNTILSELRGFLIACSSGDEIGPVAARAMGRLFPDSSGALLLLSPSKTDLESVARWGGYPEDVDENLFAPDACWGLRRGGGHVVDDIRAGLVCPHVKSATEGGYGCLPLTARGEVLGLLHARTAAASGADDRLRAISGVRELASTVAEILSLSIWNMRLRETLANQAIKDPLTGLFNRTFLEDVLQRELYRAGRKQAEIGVIMADVDHFKKFNDLHGHAAGDLVLVELANFFRWRMRKSDIVCRYGGEEFALILPESSIADTAERANQLRDAVKGLRVSYAGLEIGPVTLSMGVSGFPQNGDTPHDLLRAADLALYQAKQAGRDQVVVAESPAPKDEPASAQETRKD